MRREDLDAAAAAGIITFDQAAKLGAFLAARSDAGEAPIETFAPSSDPDVETFRFVRGFQDVFLTIGVILLLVGVGIAGPMLLGPVPGTYAGALVAFGLAVVLASGKRLVLPSIALAVGFTIFAGAGTATVIGGSGWDLVVGGWDGDAGGRVPLIGGLAALAAAGLFFAVFRLPFALALVALSLIPVVFGLLDLVFAANIAAIWLPTLLVLGILAFLAAMAFDLSDPLRRTLRSDNAFWLHLVAAPLIVHSTIALVVAGGRFEPTVDDALVVIGVVLALGLVALVVDRRAMLVAGLGYLAFAIARLMAEADVTASGVVSATLIVVGAGVVALGVGWRGIRHFLLGALPRRGLLLHLPPA
jgi:hypothetical protein